MKKVKLTKDEVKNLYDTLNQGNPQRGLTMQDVRERSPIMDKLEENATKSIVDTPQGPGESITFSDTELILKESEHAICMSCLDSSAGLATVTYGRLLMKLYEKVKEAETIPNKE